MNLVQHFLFFLFFMTIGLSHSEAMTLVISEGEDVIGEIQYVHPEFGETLEELGKRYHIGYNEMIRANPHVSPINPLPSNATLLIPSKYILPQADREGIVINLPEYRLYYFPKDENVVMTFPVGIGRVGWNTPIGETRIIAKEVNPVWRPTSKIQREAQKNGVLLPDEFPSGNDNPLGKFALRLKWPAILIHGTNGATLIGDRVSAGCIRMLPDDIEQLFSRVTVGTKVKVVNQPVKIGRENNGLSIQVYPIENDIEQLTLESAMRKTFLSASYERWRTNKIIREELSLPTGVVRQVR